MSFVAANPHQGLGTVVGNGHCMVHVQQCHGVTHSSTLRRGAKVMGNHDLARGTIVGTFGPTGRYENRTDGSSHVAVFVQHVTGGFLAVDQWVGKAVGERVIRDKGGSGPAVDDASRYFVVETDPTPD